MEILGKSISDNAVRFINQYSKFLTKPWKAVPFPPNSPNWGSFGDNYSTYLIGVRCDMPDAAFEATFCHEFFHAYQAAVGFPTVVHEIANAPDVKEFCERLRSNVLDLSADDAVRSNNLDDSMVMDRRCKQLKQLSSSRFASINDQYKKDILCIDLLLDLHHLSKEQSNPILNSLKTSLPDAYSQYVEFSDVVAKSGYDTPNGCFNIMGYIVNKIRLWNYCSIAYKGKNIRSFQRFNEYRNNDLAISN